MQTWWIDKQTGTGLYRNSCRGRQAVTLQTPLALLALFEDRFGSLLSTRCQAPDQLDKDMVD